MKRLFAGWLSALLIASVLMTGTALTEEGVPDIPEDILAEPVEAAPIPEALAELAEEILPSFEPAEDEEAVVEAEPPAESPKLMEGEALIPIDEAHFPDPAFRNYLSEHCDYEGDGSLSASEVDATNSLTLCERQNGNLISALGITSLEGIKYLTNLQSLECDGNRLTSLDVSGMSKLNWLSCTDNQLTSLNVSGCTGLDGLQCNRNQLTSLDLIGCGELEYLACIGNQLNSLVIDGCNNLKNVWLLENPMKVLDVSNCPGFADRIRGSRWSEGALLNTSAGTTVRCENIFLLGLNTQTATGSVTVTANSTGMGTGTDSIVATGKNTKVTVTATPGSTVPLDLGGANAKSFKSSNKKIATVNKNGTVTFKKAGKVKITYKVGKTTRKVTMTVNDPTVPSSVTLAPVATDVKKGDTVTLSASIPEGTQSAFAWKSSNKRVATVDKNGVVTFRKAGKVTITVTAKRGGKRAKKTFSVSK